MVLLSALAAAVPVAAQTPIPQIALWEAHMLTYGQVACAYLAAPHLFEEDLGEVYYDAERVFYQIADYTGDASWNTCAQRAQAVYRDQYVLSAAACWGGGFGCVPGYWNFTHGLTLDFLRTGDDTSRNAVIELSRNAAFAADTTPLADTESAWRSREVAYAIMSYINAEKVGAAPRARLPELVDQALGHMDQWFGSQSFRCPSICDPAAAVGQYYIQPFMVGLTSEALIMYFDKNYAWSFDYVKWRGGGASPPPPTGTLRIAITEPTNGTTVSGTAWAVVWINGATGSANSVTLTLDGRTVGSTTSGTAGPISLPFDTKLAADGTQTLTASARDASGNTGAGSVSVTVSNGGIPPPPPPAALTAAIAAPAAGATVSGTTTVTMSASGGTAPYTYTLALDGTTLVSGSATGYAWNTTATNDASHTLTLTVQDGAGAAATATRTVTVSNGPPPPTPGTLQVFVTQPRSGTTVNGTAWIVVWLSGAQGTANVYTADVNGQTVATQTTSSTGPVSLPWVTTGTPNGTQSVRVSARDASGNTGTATVTVTVAN